MDSVPYESPIGPLMLSATQKGVSRVQFVDDSQSPNKKGSRTNNPHLQTAIRQLDAYFSKSLRKFDCPLDVEGTDFQKRVWEALKGIAFGNTASYGRIAQSINRPQAARAVGGANNKNPIPIIVPCHRIIGANRKLVGYAGELWRKRWLLEHEGIDV